MGMHQAYDENIQSCKAIFVSWQGMFIALAGIVVAIIATAWAMGADNSSIHSTLREHEVQIMQIKTDRAKLDTIIEILRKRR
jgi:hypothetical protein